MGGRGGLVVYVTSHGFGHLNLAVAVINRMPAEVPVTIWCHSNLFDHWRERLRRPAVIEQGVSDAGAVNPPGDSAATDGAATIERAALVHDLLIPRVDEEAQRLRDVGAGAVLCDAPYFPLMAARRAAVPGFVLANFTWADIYAPHARRVGAEAVAFVAEVRRAYRQAVALFRAEPALRMADFDRDKVIEVGMVVTPGHDRRGELRALFGLGPTAKLVYWYVGRYGQADIGWERVAALGSKGVHFVGFHPAEVGPLPNLHVVPAEGWNGADLAASADAIVAKAGYGTACEAMAARTPMIYPPRAGFAEHRALDRALRAWGGGLPATAREFAAMKIERLLDPRLRDDPRPPPRSRPTAPPGRGEADADRPVGAPARAGSLRGRRRTPNGLGPFLHRPLSYHAASRPAAVVGRGPSRGHAREGVGMRGALRGAMALIVAVGSFGKSAGAQPTPVTGGGTRPLVRVACVGDSITFGTGLKDRAADAYPARLGKMLGPKWDVRNFGVAGATMLTKGTLPYAKQPASLDALKFNPHVVIIVLGTNDLAPFNWKSEDEFAADARGLIARFADLPVKPRVFIAYPPPILEKEFGAKDPGVKRLQPLIKAASEQTGVRLIDLDTPLAGRPDCFTDGVYPNAAGAEVVAGAVYKALSGRAPAGTAR